MSKVGRLIHLNREVQGHTICDLAAAIGRSETHLQNIEVGFLTGTPETLLAVADRLGISRETMRDAYVQDARQAALNVWNYSKKCKDKCKG